MFVAYAIAKGLAISTAGTFTIHGVHQMCFARRPKWSVPEDQQNKPSSSAVETDELMKETIEKEGGEQQQRKYPNTWYNLTPDGRTAVNVGTLCTAAGTVIVSGTLAIALGHYSGGTISAFGIYPPEAYLFTLGMGGLATLLVIHNTQTALEYNEHRLHQSNIAPLNPVAFGLGTAAGVALVIVAVQPLMIGLNVSKLHIVAANIFFYTLTARNICCTVIQSQDNELKKKIIYAIACDVAAVASIIYMPFAIAGATGGMVGSSAALAAQTVGGGALLLHTITEVE
eukprot:PhF_6_TR42851/c0_g1_i1/m.64895